MPDFEAWTSSVEHIKASPGYGPDSIWPDASMSLEENLEALRMHARHFADREGFTYTVLDRSDESRVLGCPTRPGALAEGCDGPPQCAEVAAHGDLGCEAVRTGPT